MISNRRRVVDSIEIGLGLKGAIEGFNNEEEELDLGGSLEKMEAAFEAAIDKNTTSHFDNLNLIMAASEGVESGTGFENIEKKFCEYSFNNEKTASEIKNYEDVKREADGETIEAAVGTIVANVTDGPSSSEDSNRVKLETNNDIDDKINEKDAEPVCTDLPPLGNGKQLPKLSIDCSILKNATPLEQLSAISSALRSPYGSALFAISAVTDNDFIFSVAADLVPDYNYHDSRDASLVLETMKEDAANIESSADDGPSSSKAKKRKRSSVDNEREYRCDECGKSFTQQAHLSIHQRKHTGERPYVCPYENCGKRFTQFGNLRTHERKHTGERPYKCSFPGCGKSFSQMGNMKTHEQLHSGVRPHACNIAGCNKSFTQLGNLKSHQLKVHPEMLDAHGDDLPSDPNSGSLEIDTKPVKVIKRGRKPSAAGSRQKSTSNNSSSAIVANTRPNRKAKATSSKVSYDDDIEDEVNDGISLETVPARTKSLDEIPQHMLPPRKRKVSSVFSSASSSSEPEPVSVPHDIEL